jgi:hypothetical protein
MVCLGDIRVTTLYKGDKDKDNNNNNNEIWHMWNVKQSSDTANKWGETYLESKT